MEELVTRFPFIKKYSLPIFIGFLGIIFVGYSLITSLMGNTPHEKIHFTNSDTTTPHMSSQQQEIIVDIEGGVQHSGIYRLDSTSRMQDLLIKAGGLSNDADKGWVEKHLNLAAKITDGAKIYIPRMGETVSADSTSTNADTAGSSPAQVNINTATNSDLDALPGIGLTTAGKIINGRPYMDINDLVTKKIVSQKVFGQIKDKITTN